MARRDRSELWGAVRTAGAADATLRDEVSDLLAATLRQLYPEQSAALLPASR